MRFADEVLVQAIHCRHHREGAIGVFCRGRLIGFHAYRQIAAGVGGGEAIKQRREAGPAVGAPDVERIRAAASTGTAHYQSTTFCPNDGANAVADRLQIRGLVEPVNALSRPGYRSGRACCCWLSQGETPAALPESPRRRC